MEQPQRSMIHLCIFNPSSEEWLKVLIFAEHSTVIQAHTSLKCVHNGNALSESSTLFYVTQKMDVNMLIVTNVYGNVVTRESDDFYCVNVYIQFE